MGGAGAGSSDFRGKRRPIRFLHRLDQSDCGAVAFTPASSLSVQSALSFHWTARLPASVLRLRASLRGRCLPGNGGGRCKAQTL